jgi:hypothetical protein
MVPSSNHGTKEKRTKSGDFVRPDHDANALAARNLLFPNK